MQHYDTRKLRKKILTEKLSQDFAEYFVISKDFDKLIRGVK